MHHRFVALELALDLVRQLRPIVAKSRTKSPKLADQIERAATSAVLNTGEGNYRRGKDRVHLFNVAAGSTAEVAVALECAEAWGYLERPAIETALGTADRLQRVLHGLRR